MTEFPKLKYPLDRTSLNTADGLILLAYDMIWRWQKNGSIKHLENSEGVFLLHDTDANLAGLGTYIRNVIPGGSDMFET